jgi:hypothetical protein
MLLGMLLGGGSAYAGPDVTRDALERTQELLELRLEDGRLQKKDLVPAILVSASARYQPSVDWYGTSALDALSQVLGPGGLRVCEACMAPRAWVEDGSMTYQTGPIGLDEVIRLDSQVRGSAEPARTAIWLDENAGGVSIRIIDLRNAAVLYAQNVDPTLIEQRNTARSYKLAAELERRARGDSLTQVFVDIGLRPQTHISIDWSDQFGRNNRHLAGVTLAIVDPILGLGVNYYYATPVANALVGAKVAVSLPQVLIRSLGDVGDIDSDLLDPLLTGVFVVRVPFGRSNYGALATVSTNGRLTLGISLMNISFLPVIP